MKKRLPALVLLLVLVLSLTACGGDTKAKKYTEYVEAVMNCSYKGQFDAYTKSRGLKDDNKEAKEVNESTAEFYAYQLMNYTEVEYESVDDSVVEAFIELAKKALQKTRYQVEKAEKAGKVYHVTVKIDPIDFNDILIEPAKGVAAVYNEGVDALSEDASEEQLLALENEYGLNMAAALMPVVDQIGYKETKTRIVEIQEDKDAFGLSDEDWEEIDNIVVDMD